MRRRFLSDKRGTSAIEFAILAPFVLLLLFGSLEVGLVAWYGSVLDDGAESVSRYLRERRVTLQPVTESGIRSAACGLITAGGLSCDATMLKIGVYPADNPVSTPIAIPYLIENSVSTALGGGREFVVGIAYEWGVMMPSTRLLLNNSGTRAQIQARSFAVVSERPAD